MGVITRPVWIGDQPSGALTLETQPNFDAYGLAVTGTTTELAAVDWTKFYDGTPVINTTTGAQAFVYGGALHSYGPFQQAWTLLPLTTPFVNLGGIWRRLSYLRSGTEVWVQGVVSSNNVAVVAAAQIAALPADAQMPANGASMLWGTELATSANLGNPVMARLDVRSDRPGITLGLVPGAAANVVINHMSIDLRWSVTPS